jgi:hypothetical protein
MQASGNIYAHARRGVVAKHEDRLEGNPDGLVLVVFTETLEDAARNALAKSFDAIGLSAQSCLYAQVEGLSKPEMFELVEGIDPLALVACDEKAALLCAQAARQPFPLMRKVRLFGREARAFTRLNGMFKLESDRQTVWRLLKSLA